MALAGTHRDVDPEDDERGDAGDGRSDSAAGVGPLVEAAEPQARSHAGVRRLHRAASRSARPTAAVLRMRASIRYTVAGETIVARGMGPVRVEGNEQYYDLCNQLVNRPEFAGADYSWVTRLSSIARTGRANPGAGDVARRRHLTSPTGGHRPARRTSGFVPKRRVGIVACSPVRLSRASRTTDRSWARLAKRRNSAQRRDRIVRWSGRGPMPPRRRTPRRATAAAPGSRDRRFRWPSPFVISVNVTTSSTETVVIPHHSGRIASAFARCRSSITRCTDRRGVRTPQPDAGAGRVCHALS